MEPWTPCRSQKERRETMLEQYGFECDCPACTLTGEERRENNQQRRLVADLDIVVERLLYDFPAEERPEPVIPTPTIEMSLPCLDQLEVSSEDSEEGDLPDVLAAIKISFYKLYLMERLGFKVVSQVELLHSGGFLYFLPTLVMQISVCSYILEICREWELQSAGYLAVETGTRLARCIYGDRSRHVRVWREKSQYFNTK